MREVYLCTVCSAGGVLSYVEQHCAETGHAFRAAPIGGHTVALVSCVKLKRDRPAKARDLYTSPLFTGLRLYAEQRADTWYILSALYGLVAPDTVIHPYDVTLSAMTKRERLVWAGRVAQQLDAILTPDAAITMLAGERYRRHLVPWLAGRGHNVFIPLQSMTIGRQLSVLNIANRGGHDGA